MRFGIHDVSQYMQLADAAAKLGKNVVSGYDQSRQVYEKYNKPESKSFQQNYPIPPQPIPYQSTLPGGSTGRRTVSRVKVKDRPYNRYSKRSKGGLSNTGVGMKSKRYKRRKKYK